MKKFFYFIFIVIVLISPIYADSYVIVKKTNNIITNITGNSTPDGTGGWNNTNTTTSTPLDANITGNTTVNGRFSVGTTPYSNRKMTLNGSFSILNSSGSEVLLATQTGKLGVGAGANTAFGSLVFREDNDGGTSFVALQNLGKDAGTGFGIKFLSSNAAETSFIEGARIESNKTVSGNSWTTDLGFYTSNASFPGLNLIMILKGEGNVGIGIKTPNQKLQVIGNTNVSGTIYYGALQANSPHAFMGDNDFEYTRICMIAENSKVVMQTIAYDSLKGTYSLKFEENALACLNKQITKEIYEIDNGDTITTVTIKQYLFGNKTEEYSYDTKPKVTT